MAFHGNWKDDAFIRQGADGWVGVHRSTPNYRAWEHWLRAEFKKQFFPEWITVMGEWPPTMQANADAYAIALSDIRDSRYLKEQTVIGGLPVPRHPKPWDGYVPPEPGSDKPGRNLLAIVKS